MPTTRRAATRHFTRADVEAVFEKHWGTHFRKRDNTALKIESVSLLEGLTPPSWALQFALTYNTDDAELLFTSHFTYIFTEETNPYEKGKKCLNLVHEIKLPDGCATVAEENKAMEERGKA